MPRFYHVAKWNVKDSFYILMGLLYNENDKNSRNKVTMEDK